MLNWRKLMLLSVVVLSLPFSLIACGSNDVKKAQEFMAAGMYPQAMELLNKRVSESPSDAEAHFLLGSCYIHTGNLSAANDRFLSAVRLKSDYGFQIGTEYKNAATDAVTKGNSDQAQQLFEQAVYYQVNLRESISDEQFAEGKGLFEQGQREQADSRLSIAHKLNPAKGEAIGELYFKASQQAKTTAEAVKELKTANRLSSKYKAELEEKQQQLEHEKLQTLINKLSKKYGRKPDIYEILTNNKELIVFENPKLNDGFYYLASSSFIGIDDAGPSEYPAALIKPKTVEYTGYKYINGALKIRKKDNDVRVVIWKLDNP